MADVDQEQRDIEDYYAGSQSVDPDVEEIIQYNEGAQSMVYPPEPAAREEEPSGHFYGADGILRRTTDGEPLDSPEHFDMPNLYGSGQERPPTASNVTDPEWAAEQKHRREAIEGCERIGPLEAREMCLRVQGLGGGGLEDPPEREYEGPMGRGRDPIVGGPTPPAPIRIVPPAFVP